MLAGAVLAGTGALLGGWAFFTLDKPRPRIRLIEATLIGIAFALAYVAGMAFQ
jgi:hypothetical protein